jgi:PAS domain S-box-containing protein
MKRIFGIGQQETDIDYERYLQLLHPEDRLRVDHTVKQAIEHGKAYSFEHRIRRDDGTVGWLHSNGKAESSNGKVYKLHGTALDITEQKLSQLKVQEEQFFIQKITETSPDIITVFDLQKKTNIFANRELNVLLGYSEQEFQQLREDKSFVQKLVHPDDLAEAMQFLRDFAQYTGDSPQEIEYRVKRKSGDYIWVSARYNVFRRNEQGLPLQLISITRDIHQRKLAEEKLRHNISKLNKTNQELLRTEELLKKANTDLEDQVMRRTLELQNKNSALTRINSDLDNFVYTASHDLKVPIVNLEGLLILLKKKLQDKLDEKDQHLLVMMQTSIERFKNTIQDLSDLTRMQKDLDEDNLDLISLPELIQDIKSDISQLIEENKAEIHLDLPVKEISFDRKNLRSILYNLITNAIKYSCDHRPPQIKVGTAHRPNGILISIRDNGEGIPENQQEKIFSLFKRLNKRKEGSGMGLYIVKRIVDNNGGRIEVDSTVGSGTTFKIYLQNN